MVLQPLKVYMCGCMQVMNTHDVSAAIAMILCPAKTMLQ